MDLLPDYAFERAGEAYSAKIVAATAGRSTLAFMPVLS
jgi:hypothetical protein